MKLMIRPSQAVITIKYDDEDDKTMTDASGDTARYRCPIFSWNNLSMMSCYKVWEWLDIWCLFVYCLHGLCQKMWLGRFSKFLACATWHLFFFLRKYFFLGCVFCCVAHATHGCTGDGHTTAALVTGKTMFISACVMTLNHDLHCIYSPMISSTWFAVISYQPHCSKHLSVSGFTGHQIWHFRLSWNGLLYLCSHRSSVWEQWFAQRILILMARYTRYWYAVMYIQWSGPIYLPFSLFPCSKAN